MDYRWDLSVLYDGIDTEKYHTDEKQLSEFVSKLVSLSEKTGKIADNELIDGYLRINEQLTLTEERLFSYLNLRFATNSDDLEAKSQFGKIISVANEAAEPEAVIEAYIGKIENLDELIAEDEFFAQYAYLLKNLKRDAKYLLKGGEENILAKTDVYSGQAWSDLQTTLTSSLKIPFNGEILTLSDIRNLAYDKDENVRKAAYEAELKAYDNIKESVAFCLNSIKMQAITEAELRGYSSVEDKTLKNSRVKKETLDALLKAIEKSLPTFRRYFKKKAQILGDKNGLPWYDLFAPVSCDKDEQTFTPESARDYLVKVFSPVDKELADMINKAFDNRWIDFYPRAGKTGGAFCMELLEQKQSRVLTNFGGKFTDVMTLAHELGHAYHNLNLYFNPPLATSYSMPVAETASNFNEVIVMDYALKNAKSKAEKLALLEGKLSDTAQIICDIYSRYLFEKSVIEHRKEVFNNADGFAEEMIKAQKSSYGDGLDENFLHPYMWICKSHYYSASLSFYNWPYAFGGLFAQGLFAEYVKRGQGFIPDYKKMLKNTPVCDAEEVAKIAGVDLTDEKFWDEGLAYFENLIEEFCSLSDELFNL